MNERYEEIASAMPADLDSLPRLRGFRLRGMEMTRLETFIDADFAFAISMLVIAAQQIPDNIQRLLAAFKNVPTFVCSIAVLGIFWGGPLVVEPALRPRRRRLDFDQLGDDCYDPDLYLSAEGNFRSDVVPSEQWPDRPAVLASHHRITGENDFWDLRARLDCHFRLNPGPESSCLAIAWAVTFECAGKTGDAR